MIWLWPMEMINFVPGIVPGIGMAMNCFTQKGDKVMIQLLFIILLHGLLLVMSALWLPIR